MRLRLGTLAVALAAGLAGCGNGDGGGEGLAQQEWAARADAICAEAQAELREVEVPGQLSDVPPYLDRTLPIADEELRSLRALEPADEIEERVEEFLETVERALDAARRLGKAAELDDEAQARAVGREAQALGREIVRLARGLGARTCAEQ